MGKTKISPSNSGKKLVQARLPFKTLPSAASDKDKKCVEKPKEQIDNNVKEDGDEKENSKNVDVVVSDDENISDGESSEMISQEVAPPKPSTSKKRKSTVQDESTARVSKRSLDFGKRQKSGGTETAPAAKKKRGRKAKKVEEAQEDGVIDLSSGNENEADESQLESSLMKSPQAKVAKKALGDIQVHEDYDATLNLKFSDSETEMMNESKSEKRVATAPASASMKSPLRKSPLRKSTRVTPSRKAKESKLETSVVLEVSDNAMDLCAIEMGSSAEDDSVINSTLDITDTEPDTVSTPKVRLNADQKVVSSGKKRLDKAARQKLLEEKEQQRLKEREEREERRRKEKEQRDEQKRVEKEKKEEQRRKEREEKEEQKRKEKEEKDEQRRKEKEEREKKRLAEIEAKNEEMRQKQEEKRKRDEQKEEEKRVKDEERRKKEEEKERVENKKRKEAEVFSKFFVQQKESAKKIGLDDSRQQENQTNRQNFMPFRIKDGMKLAPLWRRNFRIPDKENLDKYLDDSVNCKRHYLDELKAKDIKPRMSKGTLCGDGDKDDCEDDVQLISSDLQEVGETIEECKPVQTFRTKFLWFHANRRPPYYGTFRKKSNLIRPRRPFALDKKYFDYEVDSDDEWEEEEMGESLHGSEDEKEKESEDEYEVDNEFFVPHGHLSDEEIQKDEGFDDLEDDNEQSAEAQKEKMKILQDRFNQSIKKKTEKIQPRIVGIVWQDENGNRPESCSEKVWNSLIARSMVINCPIVLEAKPLPNELETNANSSAKKQLKIVELDEDDIKNLITLVHGNRHKIRFLINEFRAFIAKNQTAQCHKEFTFTSIRNQIDKISKWTPYKDTGSQRKRTCWMVNNETLTKYGLGNISLKNEWSYVTEPPKHDNKPSEEHAAKDDSSASAVDKNQTSTPSNIKKFTKVLTEEERVQEFAKIQKMLKETPSTSQIKSKNTSKNTSKVAPIEIINCDDSDTDTDNNEASAAKLVCNKNKVDSPFVKFLTQTSLAKCQTSNDGKVAIDIETNAPSTTKVLQTKDEDKVKRKRAILLSTPLGTVVSEDVKKQFLSKNLSKSEKAKSRNECEDDDVVIVEDKTLAAEDDSDNKRVASPTKEQPIVKKRAALLSVPLGTVIPEDVKSNFVSKNLTKKRDEQQSKEVEIVKDGEATVKPEEPTNDKETTLVAKDDTSKTSSSQKENNERTVTVTKRLASPLPEQPPVKKRAPLLSVPLGTVVSEDVKKDFISKSLKKIKPAEASKQEPVNSDKKTHDDGACNT